MTQYTDALQWLYGLESRGIKLGLDRMIEAASVRGNPERGLRYVHVAGSNGKGSVTAMVESVLRTAGYKTGLFASPHLQRYVERVRIAGRPISERELASRLMDLRADDRLSALSFFEYTTLLAFEAFRDAGCEIVVLEVGLGGRLDSTNIVTPEVGVITNVSLEHQAILGDTLPKIAREKAGILKPGVPCIVGSRNPGVRRTITRRARQVGAPLRVIDRDFEARWRGALLDASAGDRRWEGLRLGLRGRYQRDNAACALAALVELDAVGFPVSDAQVRHGLRQVKWPGRLEWVAGTNEKPAFLFDGAHNAAGCHTLATYLEELDHPGRVVVLFGAMRDKNHRLMLQSLSRVADRFVYAEPSVRRAARPSRFVELQRGMVARSVRDGVNRAVRAARPGGLVVVAGSIFLVAEVRALVLGARTDPPIAM